MRYLLLLAFVCSPAFACVHSINSTDTYAEICTGVDTCRIIFYDELGNGNNHTKRSETIRQTMQNFLDVRINLLLLEINDPDKGLDPNCGNIFWGDITGNKKISLEATHLVNRGCVVENVHWDGISKYIMAVRSTRPCVTTD
jgi:hypothetical protein